MATQNLDHGCTDPRVVGALFNGVRPGLEGKHGTLQALCRLAGPGSKQGGSGTSGTTVRTPVSGT